MAVAWSRERLAQSESLWRASGFCSNVFSSVSVNTKRQHNQTRARNISNKRTFFFLLLKVAWFDEEKHIKEFSDRKM